MVRWTGEWGGKSKIKIKVHLSPAEAEIGAELDHITERVTISESVVKRVGSDVIVIYPSFCFVIRST